MSGSESEQFCLKWNDFQQCIKSTFQERLAQRGEIVVYEVTEEIGPPHDRTFEVRAVVDGRIAGKGTGRSKKAAEQEAARIALDHVEAVEEDA